MAPLTSQQTEALFDILSHQETYAEIVAFKFPDAVTRYGYPFEQVTSVPPQSTTTTTTTSGKSANSTPLTTAPTTPRSKTPEPAARKDDDADTEAEANADADADAAASSLSNLSLSEAVGGSFGETPILQSLLTRYVLPLPGVRDLGPDFWSRQIQGILARLGAAELSESYDKGALGTRKTLATGASALLEMLGRGSFGGITRRSDDTQDDNAEDLREKLYDEHRAEDLEQAWHDALQHLIYGSLVDDLFTHMSKTQDLESLSPMVKASADYSIVQ